MIKNKKVYVRFIITYTLFLLIPLLLNVFTLNDIAAATQNNIYHSVLTDLEHAVKNLEDNLDEVDTLIENLTENMAVRNIALRMDEADKRVKHSWPSSVQSYMRSTNISKFWEEYYLFFRDSRMVISPEHIFYYDESVQYFFQYGDCSWEEWLEKLNESYFYYIFPEAETKQNFSSEKRFLYVQSLLLGAGVKGTFVFPINSETFKNMVEDAYIGHVGWAYLTDSEGRLLVSLPSDSGEFCVVPEEYESDAALQEITLDGRTVEVIRSRSEERGLELVALLPREYITTQIKQAQQRNLKLIMLAIAMGSISILAVSWLRGRKIDRILRVLSGSGIQEDNSIFKGDELVYISDSLTQLIADNAELQDNIRRQEPMTRDLLLERLLRGNSIGVEKSLEQFGICVSGKQFLVIVYQINPIDEDEVIYLKENVICKQVLQKELV